jgi:Cu-Zn family superoxide dismutase
VTLLACLGAAILAATAAATPRPSAYVLPGDAVFPEGIAFDQHTGHFYVSSTNDGSILRGHVNEPAASGFIAGTTGPFSSIGLEVDDGRLYVAGGPTGTARVYDASTGALLRVFTSGAGGFLNDLAVAMNGDVFVTDSFRPVLWRIPAGATGGALEPWVDLTGTPMQYTTGFNANGIVATPDGKYLIVSQSNTGEQFRVDLATKEVVQIDLGGEAVNGDGIELRGRTLYAASSGLIAKVRLAGDFLSGEVVSRTGDPSFSSPTTIAIARGRLLVVNSQFDRLFGGLPPVLPFTVSSIPIP